MKTLISKLQLHYFEKGDFDKIETRSLEDSLLFIRSFPWEEQRNGIFVNLNGPSVTIENGKGAFLKIGVYYHGQFILYYLNESDQIFCKIADQLSEFDSSVEDFFKEEVKEAGYNKYRNGMYQKRKYFATGSFEYGVNFWIALKLMFIPLFFLIVYLTGLLLGTKQIPIFPLISISVVLFFFGGIHWLFFFNYYFFSRKLHLKVSRGVDEFYFGKRGKVKSYYKKNIRTIRSYNNQWHKNPWSEFYTFDIEFRNGELLRFTNLMIGSFKLNDKFPEVIINNKHKAFAFVRKDNFKTIQ